MKDRVHRDLSEDDIEKIATTYHNWRKSDARHPELDSGSTTYEDEKWYCKSAKLPEIEKHGYVLTPGRYVGITDAIDDGIPFEEKMRDLTAKLSEQMKQEKLLDEEIKKQLAKIGFYL